MYADPHTYTQESVLDGRTIVFHFLDFSLGREAESLSAEAPTSHGRLSFLPGLCTLTGADWAAARAMRETQ